MHAVEDRDADVDVVVELDVVLALVGAQQSSDVLDDASLEREREARKRVSSSGQSKPSPR